MARRIEKRGRWERGGFGVQAVQRGQTCESKFRIMYIML